jgi:hypothetical protein
MSIFFFIGSGNKQVREFYCSCLLAWKFKCGQRSCYILNCLKILSLRHGNYTPLTWNSLLRTDCWDWQIRSAGIIGASWDCIIWSWASSLYSWRLMPWALSTDTEKVLDIRSNHMRTFSLQLRSLVSHVNGPTHIQPRGVLRWLRPSQYLRRTMRKIRWCVLLHHDIAYLFYNSNWYRTSIGAEYPSKGH